MCRPREPDVFGTAGTPSDVQLVAHPARDVEHARERRALARIEIERDVVGVERRLHAREPRVLRDRGDLRHVEQRDQRCRRRNGCASGSRDRIDVVAKRLDADARRRLLLARALLVERRPVDAVREALHHQRPIGDGRQQERRDRRVVAQQVALRQLQRRPEHLREVGDAEPFAAGQRRWCRPSARPRARAAARRRRRSPASAGPRCGRRSSGCVRPASCAARDRTAAAGSRAGFVAPLGAAGARLFMALVIASGSCRPAARDTPDAAACCRRSTR